MNFRSILSNVKVFFQAKDATKKYAVYAVVLILVLGVIGFFITRSINKELTELRQEEKRNARIATLYQEELLDEIGVLRDLSDNTDQKLVEIRGKEAIAQVAIQSLVQQLGAGKAKRINLETKLTEAHEKIAGRELTNSFLGERITEEIENYFPKEEHIFFSETQSNLFRTNPVTANLIYAIISENAVRIQIIGSLSDQVTIATDLLEQSDTLVTLRGEEILAYETLVGEYDEVFDNLEATLSIERQMTTNLKRQITLLTRKNFFQRVLPTLNIVVGPYYDPFRNQGGFAVALGLGWRF